MDPLDRMEGHFRAFNATEIHHLTSLNVGSILEVLRTNKHGRSAVRKVINMARGAEQYCVIFLSHLMYSQFVEWYHMDQSMLRKVMSVSQAEWFEIAKQLLADDEARRASRALARLKQRVTIQAASGQMLLPDGDER